MTATSKPEKFTRQILEGLNIDKYFDFIAAATMDGSRGKKADVIRYGLTSMNIKDPSEALMVGDRNYDVLGARACGMDCIGVTYGYGDRAEHEACKAKYIADMVEDIYRIIIGSC